MKASEPNDRALVTFVVVAYNQEEFIRESVESALSQTYQPLEIVLSDDCSTDRTFEVMQELASSYSGPHSVRLVRNSANLGVLHHAIARGREARGEIVIGQAGDDISEPDRTAAVVDAFMANPRAGCTFSQVIWIDESGDEIEGRQQPRVSRPRLVTRADGGDPVSIIGCSAAYRKWVFDVPIDTENKGYAEDMVFSFFLDLAGSTAVPIESALLRYRMHSRASTNVAPNPTEYEKNAYRTASARLKFLDECECIASKLGKEHALNLDELGKARTNAQTVVDWPDLSVGQRLKYVIPLNRRGAPLPIEARVWGAIRVLGRYPNYQPRQLLSRFQRQYRRAR